MKTVNYESYVSLEVAKLLKEAGFDWNTNLVYVDDTLLTNPYTADWNNTIPNTYTSAPTLDVTQKWLRENKNFDINILTDFDSVKRLYYVRYVVKDGHYKTYYITNNRSYVYFNTYEEALEAGIKKSLEMISK